MRGGDKKKKKTRVGPLRKKVIKLFPGGIRLLNSGTVWHINDFQLKVFKSPKLTASIASNRRTSFNNVRSTQIMENF